MQNDFRYGIRGLWRSPTFTIAATLALGIAIGTNATIFGLIDGLWFRPAAVRNPSEIVRLFSTTKTDRSGGWSFPEYQALRGRTTSFADVVARGARGTLLRDEAGKHELLLVNVVSTNFFSAMGVEAAHGRLFGPSDDWALEQQPGIVLGHAFWKRRFGGDPSVVGRVIRLGANDSIVVVVLGVLPERFRDLNAARDSDMWFPPQTWAVQVGRREFEQREYRWFELLARRRADVSVAAAQAEMDAYMRAAEAASPATNAGRRARVISDRDHRLEVGGVNALALLALVLLVALITCVNVANLLLARSTARSQELAIRTALGASRWRLLRQMMSESVLIGVLGTFTGLLIASWLIRLVPVILVAPPGMRSFTLFQIDARVLMFTAGLSLITTMLFGVAPAWIAARTNLIALVKATAGQTRAQRIDAALPPLLAAQIVVSLVLLCAAGVLTRSFLETQRAHIGFERRPMLTAWASAADTPPAIAREGARRLEALPGVTAAAVAIRAPLSLSGGKRAQPVFIDGVVPPSAVDVPSVKFNAVSTNYFGTVGIRVIAGQNFTDVDQMPGQPVIVISEQFARQYFQGRDPLGQIVGLTKENVPHRIIGVVENVPIMGIGERPEPYFYLPYWRAIYGDMTFMIATAGDPALLVSPTREALRQVDPRLEPRQFVTMAQSIDYSTRDYQATAALAATLGLIGLLLTAVGTYGVVAYRTAKRTHEIGIRLALGASRGEVLAMLLREGGRVWAVGLLLGVPAALITTRLLRALLFAIGPWDLVAFVVATAVLLVALFAATVIPAWRATRVNPSTALREA